MLHLDAPGYCKKMKMDAKRLSILNLNNDCMLQIMKYVIADCELREESPVNPSRYADMENFANVHENIKELLRINHKEIFYHRELTKVARSVDLIIDFAQLQSTIVKKKEGEAYWKLYTKAIRENRVIYCAKMTYGLTSSYPEFPKHFQMIKCALENKTVRHLNISLNGYRLDDLNNFKSIEFLYLDVRMSAEALVSVCKSNSRLYMLEFMSTELEGRLSDIVPHCPQLMYLNFVPKPGVVLAEYAPLTQLPKLKDITICGALKNGSLLTMLKAIREWQRPDTHSFIISFRDELPPLSNVAIITANSLQSLDLRKGPTGIKLTTTYDFFEISKDSRPLEQSLAIISLMAARFNINWLSRRLTLHRCPASDISGLTSLLKLLNISGLTITGIEDCKKETSINQSKLFGSMIHDLKSICIDGTKIEKPTTINLVKIKSITLLKCSFNDWESIELLSELPNLQTLDINVGKKFEDTFSKALCKLLDTCQVCAFIRGKDWLIEFKKSEKISGAGNGNNTLTISNYCKKEYLNEVLEALTHRIFKANDELDMSQSRCLDFKDIRKVADLQNLKKLKIKLSDANGIEKLSDLTELEELTIWHDREESLVKLFEQLALKESPSLQCLHLYLRPLFPEEVLMVSRIKSLKNLKLKLDNDDCAAINALANSNIEELKLEGYKFPWHKLCAEFGKNITNRLRHLNIEFGSPNRMELKELSKLKELRRLRIYTLDPKILPFLQELKHLEVLDVSEFKSGDHKLNLPSLKKLVIRFTIEIDWQQLAELGLLESLYLSCIVSDEDLHFLADMKNLKELTIRQPYSSLSELYKAFACKDGLKLKHVNTTIKCVEELNEITRIKSLRKLNLYFLSDLNSNSDMLTGQLTELESLYIEFNDYNQYEYFERLNCVPLLAILESCKNLAHFTIKCKFYEEENVIRQVHTLLKSIRNPALQGPLILTVLLDIFSEFDYQLVEYFDDAYLKVYCIFNKRHMH